MPKATLKITPKQKAFCQEYIIDFNGTQAAIRAGYSKKTAAEIACEHLMKPHIQKEVEALTAQRTKAVELSADRVLQELMNIAFVDPLALFNDDGTFKELSKIPESARRAIISLDTTSNKAGATTTKLKLCDKIAALDKLGKYLQMWMDRKEVKHTGRVENWYQLDDIREYVPPS